MCHREAKRRHWKLDECPKFSPTDPDRHSARDEEGLGPDRAAILGSTGLASRVRAQLKVPYIRHQTRLSRACLTSVHTYVLTEFSSDTIRLGPVTKALARSHPYTQHNEIVPQCSARSQRPISFSQGNNKTLTSGGLETCGKSLQQIMVTADLAKSLYPEPTTAPMGT